MQPTPNGTRREFLKQSTTTLAAASVLSAPTIITSRALGNSQQGPASDRLTLGFIGMGTMNRGHLRNFLGRKDTQVVAVCDVDRVRRESSKGIVEEHYAPEKGGRFDGCTSYTDFNEMLAREDLDAVVIATPDHWHAIAVIEACKAKKDIYCEKPLTLTIHEAKVLVDCVRKHERVLQTGSQQRSEFDGRFRTACEYVRSGRIGQVLAVYVGVGGPSKPCDLPGELAEEGLDWDRWLGPAPRRPYNSTLSPRGVHKHFPAWRNYQEYSGGGMTDFGAHHFDIAQWGLDMDESGPVEVIPPENPQSFVGLEFRYANGVKMYHGGPSGITFVGTSGVIAVDRNRLTSVPDSILKEPLGDKDVHLFKSPGHAQNWIDCIKSRKRPIADVEVGARSVTVCHLANLGYWNRRRLRWDPKAWTFVDDETANTWLDRERRKPYVLPTI